MRRLARTILVSCVGGGLVVAGCQSASGAQATTRPTTADGGPSSVQPMPLAAATQPAVPRAEVNAAFITELSNRAPPEVRRENQVAVMWPIRKAMQDGTPAERQRLLSQIKGVIVQTFVESGGEDEGMTGIVLASLVWPMGDQAAPLVLDLLSASEPGVAPEVNRALQSFGFLVIAIDSSIETTAQEDLPPQEIAGVRMLPPRSVREGLAEHQDRLAALLMHAVGQTKEAPEGIGGPEMPFSEFGPGVVAFAAVAVGGPPLSGLYDFLMDIEQKHPGLAADLAIVTAAAVAPEQFAGDPVALQKLDRVAVSRPHAALLAGFANRDLLASAAERAMASNDPEHQLSGVVLAKNIAEGYFPIPINEGIGYSAIARRLLPKVEALTGSTDARVRTAAMEARESLEMTVEWGE